jgi:hypothetical protein
LEPIGDLRPRMPGSSSPSSTRHSQHDRLLDRCLL